MTRDDRTLSQLGRRHTRAHALDEPADGTVVSAPATRDDYARIRLARGQGGYDESLPWVTNGRLPAVGDAAVVVTTPTSMIALIFATGDLL